MAITFTQLAAAGPNSDTATVTVTAPAGAIILFDADYYLGEGYNPPTATGLTFLDVGGLVDEHGMWYAVVPGGGFSGTITLTGFVKTYSIGYVEGVDTTSPFVQVLATDFGGSNPLTQAFGASMALTSGGYASWMTVGGFDPTPRSGWTDEAFQAGGGRAIATQFRADADNSIGADYGATIHVYVIAMELRAASGGGGGSPVGAAMYHHLRNMGAY